MNKALNNAAQIITMTALVILAMLSVACDKNMAKPEDLVNPAVSAGVKISKFTASSHTIMSGESTTLSWSVDDPSGAVQFISIDPIVGNVDESGEKKVFPKNNTVYHLNVYMNNKIELSRGVGITVTDEQGNEIPIAPDLSEEPVTPTSETACNDNIDEDADTLTDCDDSDCAEAANCIEPVYFFSDCEEAPHVVEGAVYAGDALTITWKNCPFDEITVNGLAGYSFSAADGAYEFSAGEAGEVTVLLVGRVNGASKDTKTVKVDVSAVVRPEFSADVTFKITPSTVFAGQSYTVSWNVNNGTAQMGSSTLNQGEEVIAVATDNTTYTLTVTDDNGITETFTKSVKVRQFKSEGTFFGKPVSKIAKGVAAGEYYFVGENNTIYKTTGNLSDVSEVAVGSVVSDIVSLAVVDESSILVGNKDGMFQVTDGTATQRVRTYGQETISAIHVRKSDRFVAGSEEGIYKVRPGMVDAFGAPFSGVINVFSFVTNPTDSQNVFAITGSGIYQSTDKGNTFVSTGFSEQNVTDGFGGPGSFYIWSKDQVFQWNGGDFSELSVVVSGDINSVYKKSGWIFVATTEGVFVKTGALWTKVFSGNVKFLLGSGIFKLTAITADGKKYGISLTPSFSTTKGGR